MITNVKNNHRPEPLAGTTPVKSNRGSASSYTSFGDVLGNHIPSPDTGSMSRAGAAARAPIVSTPANPAPSGTSPGSSTTTGPITYHTPFGDAVVSQPVTSNFTGLFTPKPSSGVSVGTSSLPTPSQQTSPTPQSVFGDQVWASDPGYTAPDGGYHTYNQVYFASPATAQKVADMVGGKVISMNAMAAAGVMLQNQPNLMVQLPDGKLINPGLIANFYNHGYPQSYVDSLVQGEIRGVENS
jgi:hypothetical protein